MADLSTEPVRKFQTDAEELADDHQSNRVVGSSQDLQPSTDESRGGEKAGDRDSHEEPVAHDDGEERGRDSGSEGGESEDGEWEKIPGTDWLDILGNGQLLKKVRISHSSFFFFFGDEGEDVAPLLRLCWE